MRLEKTKSCSSDVLGLTMLIFALLVSALMGIYQETLYATYGKHPEEALFYSVK
jgi:solute carrier family 35 (UDP-xylose/UDP-N-acetylglucosamine transporter), member B4